MARSSKLDIKLAVIEEILKEMKERQKIIEVALTDENNGMSVKMARIETGLNNHLEHHKWNNWVLGIIISILTLILLFGNSIINLMKGG